MNFTKKIFGLILAASMLFNIGCGDDEGGSEDGVITTKLAINPVVKDEGNDNTTFSFKLQLSEVSTREISVEFATEEVSAGENLDYIPKSGKVTIASGEIEAFIDIEIITDELKEDDEIFNIVLSNPVNVSLVSTTASGTIRNDDTFVDVPDDGYITPESYVGYDLIWQDEFTGSAINTNFWKHEIGAGGWGNEESQYYTNSSNNSYISDGTLILEAREENFNGANYTSARMITKDKFEFQLGRVDIRAILPEGQGIWPALWMLGANIFEVGWPYCGEIDIMELVGHEPSTIHGTAHWGPQGQSYSHHQGGAYNLNSGKFSDEYHVFSVIWEYNSIKYLVDDEEYYSITDAQVNGNYPFNNNFFFIFNIAVGGQWPGYPDATTTFPQKMYVDYIRVFQEN